MSGAARTFRWISHGAVAIWGFALLVSSHFDTAIPPEVKASEEPVARVRPVPKEPAVEIAAEEPPAAPESPPEPEISDPDPARPEPPRVVTTRVENGDVTRGAALLGGGAFPALSCSYESFPSFVAYAREMAALGARFVVVRRRQVVGSIDVESGAVGAPVLDVAYSPRARDYTGEPGLSPLARSARDHFGSGAVVMMLVPRQFDAGLFGGIARVLAERGDRHDAYREIRGRYERGDRGIQLRVYSGVRLDGTRVDLDVSFDLGEIARLPGAAT